MQGSVASVTSVSRRVWKTCLSASLAERLAFAGLDVLRLGLRTTAGAWEYVLRAGLAVGDRAARVGE